LILGRTAAQAQGLGFISRSPSVQGDLITYSGDSHLMTLAPTGTGKTSGPVICNALRHRGQLIVIDMKGEIYAATAQARRDMGQEVHVLDLRDDGLPGSLNPVHLMMQSGTEPATIARTAAAELIARGESERDRFWNDWAETMIAGAIAWLITDCPPPEQRLSALFDLYNDEDVIYRLSVMMDKKEVVTDKAARAAFASFLQLPPENTRPSVMGTTQSHLRLFDSELTRRLTDTSSMDVSRFVAGDPMTLYIIVPPFRLKAYGPLLRLWLSGLILAITERQTAPAEPTLMLCDEVGNLGRIDALLTATTLLRSFGFTLWTFWQSAAQLQAYAAQANTLVDNAGVIQAFGARNLRMAQELATMIGGISAEQILSMKPDEQLLLIDGKLTRCKQVRHYSDSLFTAVR
jgi:type IV secretion system protein VirD4